MSHQHILIGIAVLVISAIGYVLLKAYWNGALKRDSFTASMRETSAATEVPAPAPPVLETPPAEPPRVVTPAGPNPPNALSPSKKVTIAPEAQARDPFDEVNSETPMRDSLRHPERSFGPGVENNGTRISADAGISADSINAGISTFSPEFAQNGGEFMQGIGANDLTMDTFATI